jgi:hypothetical protein
MTFAALDLTVSLKETPRSTNSGCFVGLQDVAAG